MALGIPKSFDFLRLMHFARWVMPLPYDVTLSSSCYSDYYHPHPHPHRCEYLAVDSFILPFSNLAGCSE